MAHRAAILGCGGISRAHASGYAWAGIVVEAAADIAQGSVDRLADDFNIPQRYSDYRRLLAEVRPEIVSICTWPTLHEEMALAAVLSGARAIACEKPLALSLASADRIIGACRDRGVALIVGHQRRYEEPWMTARARIASGEIGAPERVLLCQAGDLQSDAVHGLDLGLFLLGDPAPEWVIGQIDRDKASESSQPIGTGARLAPGKSRVDGDTVTRSSIARSSTWDSIRVCASFPRRDESRRERDIFKSPSSEPRVCCEPIQTAT